MKALAIKYRPTNFETVVGQQAIIDILKYQVQTGTHKNCYLFTGGAGTGKTTCARILANELNKGMGNPIEIDAASNNGVEQAREIIAQAAFKAIDAEFKVYILDECHMMSNGAWNAMLKIVEEPPAKTIFIFCTTDPQKIPNTILSRVQRYDFQRISVETIVRRLTTICDEENKEVCEDRGNDIVDGEEDSLLITYTPEAIEYIAKLAHGGMRDAIMLMDKAISYSTNLTIENVMTALGTVNYEFMIELTEAVYEQDKVRVMTTINDIYMKGTDMRQFMKQYFSFILDIAKYDLFGSLSYTDIPSTYLDIFKQYNDQYFAFCNGMLPTIINLNSNLRNGQTAKSLIEATLLLLCEDE